MTQERMTNTQLTTHEAQLVLSAINTAFDSSSVEEIMGEEISPAMDKLRACAEKKVECCEERLEEIEQWHNETMSAAQMLAGSAPLKCAHCGKDAKCLARYEGHGPANFACDECCGHGNEDGWCVFLDRARALLEAEVRLSCDPKAGAEAEELRSAIEKEMLQCDEDDSVCVEDLQRMLDSIDARDSITACDRWTAMGKLQADENLKTKIKEALEAIKHLGDCLDDGELFDLASSVKKILSE